MFIVGEIIGTHGIKGDVKVKRITDFPERFAVGRKVFMTEKNQEKEFIIELFRSHKNLDILHFKGFDSINDVESFRGATLYIKETQLTPLEENEYYFHEIIGCSVYTMAGDQLGVIESILSPGANDVWVVLDEFGKEILIPYIKDVVKEVNPEKKVVKIELMEGLIE